MHCLLSFQDEDVGDRVHASDRDTIKTHVVNLMLTSPAAIQKQLSNSIAIIGQHDFPDKWQTLIPEMVSKFQTGDFHVINGVLQTAFSIFEKYSYEMKSQKLWTEVITLHVICFSLICSAKFAFKRLQLALAIVPSNCTI